MNRLLIKQRRWLTYSLLFEVLFFVALFVAYIFYPDYTGYFYVAVGSVAILALYHFALSMIFNYLFFKTKGKTETSSAEIIGNELNEAYNFGEIGLAVTNKDDDILWVNDFLGKRCPDIVDRKIQDVFPGLVNFEEEKNKNGLIKIDYENHAYRVERVKDVGLYVFKDVTEFDNVSSLNQKQAPVVGIIAIDNYSDVHVYISDETKFIDMVTKTRSLIHEFSVKYMAMVKQINDDHFFFVMTKENFDKLYQDRFSLVDDVRNAFHNGFTLSIGVSYGFDDYSKLSDLASAAIDVALSRGGDQTVISPFGQSLIYMGGKTELKPARNRVKMRTISNSFMTILRSYPKVLIIGHDNADFDAIGSCLGVYLLCQYVHVPAKICWEDQHVEDKCRVAVKSQFTEEDMETIFATYREASEWADKQTLLVMCDHNNPKISMFPELVKEMPNIAIIDHHRPGGVVVSNPVFSSVDTSSSSASELLTSYIFYSLDDISIDARTATFLLAGIALDTRFFKEKASMSTFEAAAELKNFNADSSLVDDFLKENLEEYRQKVGILNNSETPYYGVLIAVSPDDDIVNQVILAQVATDAIRIRGIQASFCIGRVSVHEIKVSARSDGSINCQLLMEKMGGGGHFAMAACAFTDSDVATVKKKLVQVLADYLEDAKVRG